MKVYDLKGIFIEGKKAVIAVALPMPQNGNAYYIFETHLISKTEILIHFKDFTGKDFTGESDYFHSFFIDLNGPKFVDLDVSKGIDVVLCHENNDVLNEKREDIFDRESNETKVRILGPGRTGTGTIKP